MTSNYNVYQQVFSLSMASNVEMSCINTQAQLQKDMASKLPGLISNLGNGQWQVSWGPAVWQDSSPIFSQGPDNAWYVAHNPAVGFEDGSVHEMYVVAIAGTATVYDWLVEDFEVYHGVDFANWIKDMTQQPVAEVGMPDPSKTYVALDTFTAVWRILNLEVNGQTLYSYLQALIPKLSASSKIVFTGHSLGGALSPSLALALEQSGVLPSNNTLVYPTAGPTAGDANFRNLFNQTFPPTTGSGYEIWNCNIVNKLDVVPQAWCTDRELSPGQNLYNIVRIWGELQGELYLLIDGVVDAGIVDAEQSNLTYYPIQVSQLPPITPTPPPPPTPTSLDAWKKLASEQHVNQYFVRILGIQEPNPPPCNTKIPDEQVCFRYPVIGKIARVGEYVKKSKELMVRGNKDLSSVEL